MRRTITALALLLLAAPLSAQRDRASAASSDSVAMASPERKQLERRLHQRVLDVVRDRLSLTQEQVDKLSATTERVCGVISHKAVGPRLGQTPGSLNFLVEPCRYPRQSCSMSM